MGTAHGAEELGLCSHGMPARLASTATFLRENPMYWPNLAVDAVLAGKPMGAQA